ncbi:hypothetical protein [Chitinibacter sp. S2-10]|uniref:hypothetical protein n=1 Tax=Chitinibacter sp. S2-10 TaxID=3373597 RepID=UPI003977C007
MIYINKIVLCGLFFSAYLSAFATDLPSDFTFSFKPSLTKKVIISTNSEKVKNVNGGPSVTDVVNSVIEGKFTSIDNGYIFSSKLIKANLSKNGKSVDDVILKSLTDLVVDYKIAKDGTVEEIKGFDRVEMKVRDLVPASAFEAIKLLISQETMAAKEKEEWNGRYAGFSGEKFRIGDNFSFEVPYTLPNGLTLNYSTNVRFTKWEACPAGMCVRIDIAYTTDNEALSDLVDGVAKDLNTQNDNSMVKVAMNSQGIRGHASRLIDPKTMMIFSERLERTFNIEANSTSSGKQIVSMKENKVIDYQYISE